jgi:hypothetical protein
MNPATDFHGHIDLWRFDETTQFKGVGLKTIQHRQQFRSHLPDIDTKLFTESAKAQRKKQSNPAAITIRNLSGVNGQPGWMTMQQLACFSPDGSGGHTIQSPGIFQNQLTIRPGLGTDGS